MRAQRRARKQRAVHGKQAALYLSTCNSSRARVAAPCCEVSSGIDGADPLSLNLALPVASAIRVWHLPPGCGPTLFTAQGVHWERLQRPGACPGSNPREGA